MLVVGTSLGAASAVDFATAHPEAVRKLAIIDGQAFVDGLGPVAKLPPWLAGLGVQVGCYTTAELTGKYRRSAVARKTAVGWNSLLHPDWPHVYQAVMLARRRCLRTLSGACAFVWAKRCASGTSAGMLMCLCIGLLSHRPACATGPAQQVVEEVCRQAVLL